MKRIIPLLIVFTVIISSICVSAFDGNIVIEFLSNENRIETLEPDSDITARVNIAKDNAILTLMLIKDNEIVDLAVDTISNNNKTVLNATINTPSDINGCFLRAVLWESLYSMKPYLSAAIFPDNNSTLKNIKAGDLYLSGFDTDVFNYSYPVSIDDKTPPYITASAYNGASCVDIKTTLSFPGKTFIKVTAADKTTSDYEISYHCEFNPQNFISDFTCFEDTNAALNFNLISNSSTYKSNTYETYENISEELLGSAFVQFSNDYKKDGGELYSSWSGNDKDWISFNLLKTARIYVISDSPFEKLQDDWEFMNKNLIQKVNSRTGEYKDLRFVYSKKVIVNDAPENIIIPNMGKESSPYSVFIKFEYDEVLNDVYIPETKISNIRYLGPFNSGTNYYFDYPKYKKNFNNNSLLFNDYTELVARNIDNELLGLDYITMSNPIKGSNPQFVKDVWGGNKTNWFSFDLHKSAKIIIVVNSGNINAFKNDGFIERTSSTQYFNLHNTLYSSNTPWATLYEKEFIVTDEPITVYLTNPYGQGNRWGYIVLIEWLND